LLKASLWLGCFGVQAQVQKKLEEKKELLFLEAI
jgi:hypothetical protein